MKTILLLGAGFYYKTVIKKLIEARYYVIAVDKDPSAEGQKLANEFYPIDIIDREAVLALAVEKRIDGIMNVNEFGSRTASFVAKMMNLPGHSFDTVEATNDKGIMRDKWKLNNLSMPKYFVLETFNQLELALDQIGYPAVLKPTDSGGSGRGVSILYSNEDINWAFDFSKQYVRNGRFIVEQFIEGVELTVETFTIKNKTHILAISDKIKPNLKTRVATSLNYPAGISEEVRAKVVYLVSEALSSLGIQNGIAHTEVIVSDDGTPYLVETGARGGGGHIFHTIIEIVSGINAPVLLAQWLTNQNISINEIQSNGCCYRFFNPPRGILESVEGMENAINFPGVCDIAIVKNIGEEVGNLENSLQRAGYVVTKGKDRQEAISIADDVEKIIFFKVR